MPENSAWLYDPSFGAAIFFALLYASTMLAHIGQAWQYRTRFCLTIITGAVWEVIGFAFRAASIKDGGESVALYAMQLVFIVLAPAFVCAFYYMLLGRLLHHFLPGRRIWKLSSRTITRTFVACDIVSFLVQSAGSGILGDGSNRDQAKIGQYVIIGGLCVQLASFGLFIFVSAAFHRRFLRLETRRNVRMASEVKLTLTCLYVGSALILVRSVYRIVDFAMGWEGYLARHEAFFYCLEALLMLPPFFLFNIFHPGRIIGPRYLKITKGLDDEEAAGKIESADRD